MFNSKRKNSLTNKKIKIYVYYQVIFHKNDYNNYQIAKKYVEQLSVSSPDDKEKLMRITGFKKNDSLLDLIDNFIHFLSIVCSKTIKIVITLIRKYSQSLVAYHQNNQHRIKRKNIKNAADSVIKKISIDKKHTVTVKKDTGFVEIAIWVNNNTEKNKRMFIFNHGDLFDFYGKNGAYFTVQKVIVMTIENINIPSFYSNHKPYYYKEI